MAGVTAPAVAGGKLQVLGAMLTVQAVNTWAMLAIAAVAPAVAGGLGLAAVMIGYQIALTYLVASAVSLVAGGMVTRWGATRTCQVSLLAAGLGVSLAAMGSITGVVLASITIGFGYGLVNPASSHLLFARTTPRDRSLVFSIKQTGVPLGGVLAGLITPALAESFGWQQAVLAVLLPALVLVVLLQRVRPSWDSDRIVPVPGGPRRGLGIADGVVPVWQSPYLRALCLTAFCFAAIQMSLVGFVVTFAVADLGFGAVLAGVLLATVQVAGVSGRLGWGLVADRTQNNAAVIALIGGIASLGCIGFFLLSPATPLWLVFALAVLFGATAVGWNGVFLAEVATQAPAGRIGSVTGIVSVVTFAGVVVGPALFAVLHGVTGSFGASFLALILPAAAGSAFVLMVRR